MILSATDIDIGGSTKVHERMLSVFCGSDVLRLK